MRKIEEFWYCVAPQDDIPLPDDTQNEQQESYKELIGLLELYDSFKKAHPDFETVEIVKSLMLQKPKTISSFRKLIDISDKRLYLDLTYLINYYDVSGVRFVDTNRESLVKHSTTYFINYLENGKHKDLFALEVAKYFCDRGLADSLEAFYSLTEEQLSSIFTNLIINRETLHRDAKLRGHGVEQAFAKIFKLCGVSIFPANKDEEPMGEHDPNVDLSTMQIIPRNTKNQNCHSFDLIIKDTDGKIKILVQSLIHTSDPGQYGVNKSDETVDIYRRIGAYNAEVAQEQKVYLLGSVDGVGFSENPNGTIVKMLDAFDDFFQMHTLFKIPLFLQKIGMINNVLGIAFDKEYFGNIAIQHFTETYLQPLGLKDFTNEDITSYKCVRAGKAVVIFK